MKAVRRKVTISMDPDLVSWLDELRADVSRSRLVERLLTAARDGDVAQAAVNAPQQGGEGE
ncbi:MAG TPA: hypothetical protein VEO96_07320 [Thermoplasmata archaeon]|nr:hypothetical protein [Thermoplasmata archaeon]